MYKWLSYGAETAKDMDDRNYFLNREWSFTTRDDIYTRYRCFANAEELRRELVAKIPYKIDIGAVFSAPPRDHKSLAPGAFFTKERELVFDVDMSDYTRTCCEGAKICPKCWPYMTVAVKVMDRILREDFGFKHMMWIYSGRRGVHCWVADKRARLLSNDARSALVDYCAVHCQAGDNARARSALRFPLLPFLKTAYTATLKDYFQGKIMPQQHFFAGAGGTETLLAQVPFEDVATTLRAAWADESGADKGVSSLQKWNDLRDALLDSDAGKRKGERGLYCLQNITFSYLYPRLDVNVSKAQNHLLKSPFCVHPGTGNVCVAFEAADAENFSPFDRSQVPHVSKLSEQVAQYNELHGPTPGIPAYMKCALKGSMEVLEKFVKGVLEDERSKRLAAMKNEPNIDW